MRVPFFDLSLQYKQYGEEVEQAFLEILRTQKFILGKYVNELEEKLASLCGTRFAVAVSSGTDAILASLMAIGIKAGDEVILPDFTFFANKEEKK